MKSTNVRALPHDKLFQDDVCQARGLLTERGWLFEELQMVDSKKEERWGLVFASPTRLLTLAKRGWFMQFDATHKLNRWGHNMFRFLYAMSIMYGFRLRTWLWSEKMETLLPKD